MPASNPLEVLVVDDDPSVRELLGEYFRDRGLVCATAHDGRAAAAALQRSGGRYGLVLTDIAMPGADGFAVLEAARAANRDAYVVMMTGFAALDTAIQAVRAGAQDYLTKPFSLGQIDVVLRRVDALRSRQAAPCPTSDRAAGIDVDSRLSTIEDRLAAIERSLDELVSLVAHGRRLF